MSVPEDQIFFNYCVIATELGVFLWARPELQELAHGKSSLREVENLALVNVHPSLSKATETNRKHQEAERKYY